jgi:hypothetical protein
LIWLYLLLLPLLRLLPLQVLLLEPQLARGQWHRHWQAEPYCLEQRQQMQLALVLLGLVAALA